MDVELGLLLLTGFFAQLVDGALGMAFGVISTTAMLSMGLPPAQASAIVHTAEIFTTGASAASHIHNRNVDWRLVTRLGVAGQLAIQQRRRFAAAHGFEGFAQLGGEGIDRIERQVATLRAKIDTQSALCAAGRTPRVLTRPRDGLSPTMLFRPAGTRPDPAVSVPRAKSTSPVATP